MDKYCKHCSVSHPDTPEYWTALPKGKQCKEYKRAIAKVWRSKYREKHRAYTREYNARNPEQKKLADKEWRIKNKERKRINDNNYKKLRKASDPSYRIRLAVRSRLKDALNGKLSIRTKELLGCTDSELVVWLERQWSIGMSWDNYGSAWHIDHLVPLAQFDLTKECELKAASHYENLQPMWADENRKKGSRIDWYFQ